MKEIQEIQDLKNILQEKNMTLIYFSSNEKCSVCTMLKEKINNMLDKYNIKIYNVNIDNVPMAVGEYNIFTVPTILFYIDGKEILREGRYISLLEFEEKIKRYCDLYD